MLALLLSLFLSINPQETPQPPSPERVTETVLAIKESLAKGEKDDQILRLQAAAEVPSKDVARVLEKTLKNKQPEVVAAAIQGLRWMKHPAALRALQKAYAGNKALRKNDELQLSLIKAIGQHGAVSSIKLLVHEVFALKQPKQREARIFSLGMIRHRDAVEAIFQLIRNTPEKRILSSMGVVRISLMMLTGVDNGPQPGPWKVWWKENQKTFKMAPISHAIPRKILDRWTRYWGLDIITDRRQRREDRGL